MSWPPAASFLAPLAPWFHANHRPLPWRAQDLDALHPDPYAVLVSEFMLQQTQVSTVIPYFERWMERFPSIAVLANASSDEIHKHWEGLGYYRRARNLQTASQSLMREGWPGDLSILPGVGPYTAAALSSIAFQRPAPALDGNVFRVTARLLALAGDPRRQAKALAAWLVPALEAHGPSRMTQSLMELGATICTPTGPNCTACPLRASCVARAQGLQDQIPPPKTRPAPKKKNLWLPALQGPRGWLLRPPATKGLLAGLWSWPTVEGEALCAAPPWVGPRPFQSAVFPGWVQIYTHRRETIQPLWMRFKESFELPAPFRWVEESELQALPLGSRDQRLRRLLLEPRDESLLPEEAVAPWLLARLFQA